FQAEDGIRVRNVTGVQTCALPILLPALFLVVSSVGMVNTTSFSLGMQRQGKIAGSASAFLGILPFGGGGLVSPLVGIAATVIVRSEERRVGKECIAHVTRIA